MARSESSPVPIPMGENLLLFFKHEILWYAHAPHATSAAKVPVMMMGLPFPRNADADAVLDVAGKISEMKGMDHSLRAA